jgi:hypothetical protein
MKSRIGSKPASAASRASISPASSGWTATSLTCEKGRPHREHAQEQREADQHLRRRDRLQAEPVAGQAQHDDEPGEGGHQQQQDRRDAATVSSSTR